MFNNSCHSELIPGNIIWRFSFVFDFGFSPVTLHAALQLESGVRMNGFLAEEALIGGAAA